MSTAIIFSCDNNYAVGVYINIIMLEKKSPKLADKYIIYEDSWTHKNIEKVRNLSNKIEFIPFSREKFFERNKNLLNSPELSSFIDRWGHYKLGFSEFLTHLKNFERLLFLDSDLLILSDITELGKLETMAWRDGLLRYNYKGKNIPRPNAGVILFHRSIPYIKIINSFSTYLLETESDELALAALVHDLKINIISLPPEYNLTPAGISQQLIKDDIKIYHCTGRKKIWNSGYLQCLFPEFTELLDSFGVRSNDTSKGLFSSRYKFIRGIIYLKVMRPVYTMSVDDSVKIDYDSIFTGNIIFNYTKCSNIKFRVKHLAFEKFRLYIDFNIEKDIEKYKKKIYTLQSFKDFKYHKYKENKHTFYITCKKSDIYNKFTTMTSEFIKNIEVE